MADSLSRSCDELSSSGAVSIFIVFKTSYWSSALSFKLCFSISSWPLVGEIFSWDLAESCFFKGDTLRLSGEQYSSSASSSMGTNLLVMLFVCAGSRLLRSETKWLGAVVSD